MNRLDATKVKFVACLDYITRFSLPLIRSPFIHSSVFYYIDTFHGPVEIIDISGDQSGRQEVVEAHMNRKTEKPKNVECRSVWLETDTLSVIRFTIRLFCGSSVQTPLFLADNDTLNDD